MDVRAFERDGPAVSLGHPYSATPARYVDTGVTCFVVERYVDDGPMGTGFTGWRAITTVASLPDAERLVREWKQRQRALAKADPQRGRG